MEKIFNANTVDHWREKHIREYDLDKPYNFSQIEESPLSYHTIASHILNENKDIFKYKSMLEIGCAGGYFSTYVATNYLIDWEITGWDFSDVAISSAQHKTKHINNLNFEVVDILSTPVSKNYGAICCFETIEHMPEGDNYRLLDNWLNHCEYLILSTVDTEDSCGGEHISHYKIDTFANKGYNVLWSSFLAPIQMPNGTFHYFINLIKGKL